MAITIKTPAEIESMRKAGRIVEDVLLAMKDLVRPGVSTLDLDRAAAEIIRSRGATASFLNYRGYPKSICASVNEQVVHGIPGGRTLVNGDIVSIDVGAYFGGWHGDAARTFFVGAVAPEVQKLVRVTRDCFYEGFKVARPGNRIGDISAVIQAHAEAHGYGVVRELVGHGIGRQMHEAPDVPNYGSPGYGIRLKPGMTIAIEPMINLGTARVQVLADGWTVVTQDKRPSAHYENTIAITDGAPELLTLTQEEHGPEVEET